jgi:thioester reductase-like protein
MGKRDGVLLTGATGFLGGYLLRELAATGQLVVVLARDAGTTSAEERVRGLISTWNSKHSPQIVVLAGDVRTPHLGLSPAKRHWVARNCTRIVHSAASVAFQSSSNGDPWTTNVEGTARVLDLCHSLGISEMHHLSTAFVCGNRSGRILEADLERGQRFHNDYERSKYEAERRVRSARTLRATIYRPSVIVGDSHTGATSSYHGFYRFLEAADRLATPLEGNGRRTLPLRLPLDGVEQHHLVCVDWVARAVARIMDWPALQGRTYHIVSRQPVRMRCIKEVAENVLRIDGVAFQGRGPQPQPSSLEELFLSGLSDYEPYLHGDLSFDCRNTAAALPDLPAPKMDRACLTRLIRFAKDNNWGRGKRRRPRAASLRCAHYIEEFFPPAVRRSTLASLPLDVMVRLEIVDAGCWHCHWIGGELTQVRHDVSTPADVVYRLNSSTFENVVHGRVSPHDAFLDQAIEIDGDIEKGLKLAVLFGRFVREFPYPEAAHLEASRAVAVAS